MENNSAMVSFGDLMSILLACFMLVSALLATKVIQEYSTQVNLTQQEAKSQIRSSKAGASSLFLSVTKDGRLILEGSLLPQKEVFDSNGELQAALQQLNPSNLYIRGDKGVSYGTVLSVLLDCQKLGIPVALSAENKGG